MRHRVLIVEKKKIFLSGGTTIRLEEGTMRHRVLIVEKKKSSCPGGPRSA